MKRDPRILILSIFFAPEPIGISKYTAEMAAWLSDNGFDIRVVTAFPFYPQWRLYPGYPIWRYHREKIGSVEVVRSPLWVPAKVTGVKRLFHLFTFGLTSTLATLAQWRWRPDLVWVVMPATVNVPAALLLSRLRRVPSWLHVQDFELDLAKNLNLLPGWMTRLLQAGDNVLFTRFARVSTISQTMMDQLHHEKKLPQSRTKMLPNWVDCTDIYPLESANPFRAELRIPESKTIALFSGNMGRKYGLDTLAETARLLQQEARLQFVFCGDGVGREELEVASAGLPNVHFLPLQPPERLNELLNLADIHLLPQKSTAANSVMPSKLLGMLASGRPIVATVHPDSEIGQVVQDCGVIVPPEDAPALAAALRSLLQQPERCKQYGVESRRLAEAKFDQAQILSQFALDLKILLSERR